MKGKTYFISGGMGFLGQHVVQALGVHDPTAELRVFDCQMRRTLLDIESMRGVKLIIGDLRNPDSFAVQLQGVDAVIHCAGLISTKSGCEDRLLQCNIEGTRNLLQAALAAGCEDFIFISSISAVDSLPGRLSDETMIPDLEEKRRDDPYGYSKLVCENALRAEAKRMRCIILNPSVIVGPGSALISKVLTFLRWMPFCPMLANVNSFVDVRDVAMAVVLSLSCGRSGERYIVTSENVDHLTFMRMVLRMMGKRGPVFQIPDRWLALYDVLLGLLDKLGINPGLKESSSYNVDKQYCTEKIRREMGWRPDFTLEQTLYFMLTAQTEEVGYESERPYRLA